MPTAWHSLPFTRDPRVLVKAPTLAAHEEVKDRLDKYNLTILPHAAEKEADVAIALLDAIPDLRQLGLGEKYTVWRFARGLTVEGPSGWRFMITFDVKTGEAKLASEADLRAKSPSPRRKAAGKPA